MTKTPFRYNSKTGIAKAEGFKKKGLADYAVNIGNVCEFACSYCYVPDLPFQHPSVKELLAQGYNREEISNYRDRDNILATVAKDLKRISPDNTSTVFFCTTCDPCANAEHVKMTTAAAKLILSQSKLKVRILSKSDRIVDAASELSEYKDRVFYGLSTGTCLAEISRSIETNATPIKNRIAGLHWLQDHGFRTFGMICPVLPSEKGRVKELLDQVRPEFCEDIWVEAINDKGYSLTNTLAALEKFGLDWHSYALKGVMGSKDKWRQYTKELYVAFERELWKRGSFDKFHYLQYVTKADRDFFSLKRCAVCL